MKKCLLTIVGFATICLVVSATSLPIIKVDFNEPSRQDGEVLEPGYTAWKFPKDATSGSLTVDGVTFTAYNDEGKLMRNGWNKNLVQSKEGNVRFLADGLSFGNKGLDGTIHLKISGLPAGNHQLHCFHNTWQDPETHCLWPIYVSLNGDSLFAIARTARQTVMGNAACSSIHFSVSGPAESVVISFRTNIDDTPEHFYEKSHYDVTPLLNGFELNTIKASNQAKMPIPADEDYHVDADERRFLLRWSPANANIVSHHLYVGTDAQQVEEANTQSQGIYVADKPKADTCWLVDNLYNLHTYYWRVDEEDTQGNVTKGKVWSFRPRHLAFRGAEGYGRFATGGRGGKVVYVTNLNAKGPGSFHEAITNDIGPRTILFAVSGIIRLDNRLTCSSKYVTIAGQTAPGKGICLRAAPFGVGSESICRFLRVRLGGGQTFDGLGMAGANHSITDHCSISWTIDEAFSSRNAKNITLQRTLISEALNVAGHKNYEAGKAHGFAATIGGDIGSFHHNLLAHNNGRNWSLGGGLDGDGYYAGRMDIFNNVVYNWNGRTTDGGAHEVNFVNNYYKEGPACNKHVILTAQLEGTGKGSQSYFYSGNILQAPNNGRFTCNGTDNTCGRRQEVAPTQKVDWQVWVDHAFFPSFATVESAKDAYKNVLSDVGCNLPLFDEHDQRMLRETRDASFSYRGSKTNLPGIIDNEADCGGYEDYGHIVIDLDEFDSDRDGLPNWWEELFGSNPNSPIGDFSDSNADPDRDGYTALEDYLEWMATPHYYAQKNETKTIDLSPYTYGFDPDATYTQSMVEKGVQLSFEGSRVQFCPAKDFTGICYFDFTVTDKEGSAMTRRIGVLVQDKLESLSNKTYEKVVRCQFDKASHSILLESSTPIAKATLIGSSGEVIDSKALNNLTTWPIRKLEKGVYFLRLRLADGRSVVEKIVV